MAYFSQERKKEKMPKIKAVLKKWGMKGTVSVRHMAAVIVTLRGGRLAFANDEYINECYIERDFEGEKQQFLQELLAVLMEGNHDNSDAMTDYFDVGWYVDIRVENYQLAA